MQAGGREGVVEERMKVETRMQEGWMTSVEEMKMIIIIIIIMILFSKALFHVKHAQLRCTMPMNNTHTHTRARARKNI